MVFVMRRICKITIFTLAWIIIAVIFCERPMAHESKQSADLRLVLIRHGEKSEDGDNLSCKGMNRSLELPGVLFSKFGVPGTVYVPKIKNGESTIHARMFQTITPLAVKYNIKINTMFKRKDYQSIADEAHRKTGTVLLIWNHSDIQNLAKALGAKNAPVWGKNDFDTIWIITWRHGVATLTVEKEGLTPSNQCPF